MANKKWKKLAAAIAFLMLAGSALSGCGPADAGYLSLYTEAAKLTSYTMTGTMAFEVNPGAVGGDESGLVKIGLDYSGSVSVSDDGVYLDCKINYGVNDNKKPYELNIKMEGDTVYVPVKDLIQITALSYQFQGISDKMGAGIKAALENELADNDYVAIDLVSEEEAGAGTGIDVQAAIEGEGPIMDSLAKMFSGLDSGMTKKTADGYAIEITPENAIAFADNFVKYVGTNKKAIYKEAMNLLDVLTGIYGEDFMAGLGIEGDEQGFYDSIDAMTQSYNSISAFDKEEMALTYKGSYIKDSLSKSGDAYTENTDALINYQGAKALSFKNQTTTVSGNVSIAAVNAANPISIDDFTAMAAAAEKKINHATEMTISWWNGSENDWTSMDITRVEGVDYDYADRFIDSGTMYLPMRQICEWFGEDVYWDNAAKKAYVTRDGQNTEMTGMIIGGRTFVKIRDFEKLGYTVDYQYDKDNKEHTVTISK